MPTFVPEEAVGGPVLQGIANGGFRVDGIVHLRGVLLTPSRAVEWEPPAFEALDELELAAILDPKPEFLLLGTGASYRRPPAPLVAALDARGIGIEAMDSRAAARAWVIVRGEDRAVAAALYALA
ncbi:Mth938-like domain-containing protein [Sphingomonas sp.]|uniref:Mth938-like domain-containing protein n=1 Tax=Sphingomonas sp. TaxID=28214 RepID=UPI003B008913